MCFLLSPSLRSVATLAQKSAVQPRSSQLHASQALCQKNITCGTTEGLINDANLKSLCLRKDLRFPPTLVLRNTRPVGRQVLKNLCNMLIIRTLHLPSVTGYVLWSRIPCSCWSLSFFWLTLLQPPSYCSSHFGFLLGCFLPLCLFFLYHCFSRSLLALMWCWVKILGEHHLLVPMPCGTLLLWQTL